MMKRCPQCGVNNLIEMEKDTNVCWYCQSRLKILMTKEGIVIRVIDSSKDIR